MKRMLLFLFLITVLFSCKNKKAHIEDNEVEVADFIDFFPETPLPVQLSDADLLRNENDSSLISYEIFTRFIPDSVLTQQFGKGIIPKLYPWARAKEKGKETYLIVKALHGSKGVGYLVCFNKNNEYLNSLVLVKTGDRSHSAYGMLDKKFQITTYREQKKNGDVVSFKRNIYVYNAAANLFTLILTEPNEDIIENVINPIDTLPHKNKFTGDYILNKKNFISIRDSRKSSEILFFIHFEKNKGECNGELKGSARFISSRIARFKESANPCMLEFTFNNSSVVLKEIEGCGSYRDIKCFFEGSYPKKREVNTRENKKKKSVAP